MGDTFRFGPNQTLQVLESTTDALLLESTWATGPGKPPPAHYHPRQDEHFEVLDGVLTVQLGKEPEREYKAGETIDVPRGTPHRMWNATAEPVRASWRVTPALRTEEMLRFTGAGMTPLRIPVLLWTYRNEYRVPLPIIG